MRGELLEKPRTRSKGRALIILFGALPATYLCWYAFLILLVGNSLPFPKALIPYAFGFGGFYGTLALWRIAFGCRSRFDNVGLIVGMIASVPMFLLTHPSALSIIAVSPLFVATIVLLRQAFRRHPDDLLRSNPRRLFRRGKRGRSLSQSRW